VILCTMALLENASPLSNPLLRKRRQNGAGHTGLLEVGERTREDCFTDMTLILSSTNMYVGSAELSATRLYGSGRSKIGLRPSPVHGQVFSQIPHPGLCSEVREIGRHASASVD